MASCAPDLVLTPPDTLIALGKVLGPHATRGELRIHPFNPDSATLHPGSTVVLRRGAHQEEHRITAIRRHKHYLLATLEGCDSMTAAEALKGSEVCVREADLPATGPDEIYHYQLLGMTVVTTAGDSIGTVADVMTTGSNDVCVVRGDGREHLIPMIADVVKHIDREQRRLVIDPVPGLLNE